MRIPNERRGTDNQGTPTGTFTGDLLRHKWGILFIILFIPTSLDILLRNGVMHADYVLISNAVTIGAAVGALRLVMWVLFKVWQVARGGRP